MAEDVPRVMPAPSARRAPLVHLSHPDHHAVGYEIPEGVSRSPSRRACVAGFLGACAVAAGGWWLKNAGEGGGAMLPEVSLVWVLPFFLLLACIAVMPFAARHFWEKAYAFVSIGLGLVVVVYYWMGLGALRIVAASFADYISFMFLLGSLFVVSGGVIIHVRCRASPWANTVMLGAGALLANVFGTTGAAMLLIRPFLRLNKDRVKAYQIVFFIFVVANVGGALTPVGDPPLFLGYLRGVPFWWVFQHCRWIWLTAVGCLLAVFFIIDFVQSKRPIRDAGSPSNTAAGAGEIGAVISIFGAANLFFIVLILGAVFCESPVREILMAVAAFGSLATTSRRIYGENQFNYAPIKEVALLFVGIFATMVPAMNYLHNHANDGGFKRALHTPGQFYFASGALSSVLDNAPTYVTFLETGLGNLQEKKAVVDRLIKVVDARAAQLTDADTEGLSADERIQLQKVHEALLRYHGDAFAAGKLKHEDVAMAFFLEDSGAVTNGGVGLFRFLIAISMGAVFFGACTYIGNGPNFMVKSIAEHAGVKMPSFFMYIVIYTLPILMPILVLCWLLYLC